MKLLIYQNSIAGLRGGGGGGGGGAKCANNIWAAWTKCLKESSVQLKP